VDGGKKDIAEKESKTNTVIFSAAEQRMLMELYEILKVSSPEKVISCDQ